MLKFTAQIGATLRFDAENVADANDMVTSMLRNGFGPTLGGHNVQIYEPSEISLSANPLAQTVGGSAQALMATGQVGRRAN